MTSKLNSKYRDLPLIRAISITIVVITKILIAHQNKINPISSTPISSPFH